jgi:hypothetical protein
VIAAADALVELHSYRVAHVEPSETNIMVLSDPNEPLPIRFVDFGCSLVIPLSKLKTTRAKSALVSDRVGLFLTLVGVSSFTQEEVRPLLREIPHKDSVQQLIDLWGIKPTVEEEKARHIARWVKWGISEEKAKEKAEQYIF